MSGGTPVGGGGRMRQRYSQGYTSSGDDLEDDACCRPYFPSPPTPGGRTWLGIIENTLWIVSAAFVIYFGDRHSNLIFLLWHDDRIRRLPLYLGMVGIGLNVLIFIYTIILAWRTKRLDDQLELRKWETVIISVLPFMILFGVVSFFLLSFSLWPVWGFLTLPLLFTLFMACIVTNPPIMNGKLQPQYEDFRTD